MFPYIPPENTSSKPVSDQGANQMTDGAYRFARQRLGAGASPEQIETDLLDAGFGADVASQVVKNLAGGQLRPIRRVSRGNARSHAEFDPAPALELLSRGKSEAAREAGRRMMFFGALWFIGGSVITVVTMAASNGGGGGIIWWGAILWGAIQFFRGMNQASSNGGV